MNPLKFRFQSSASEVLTRELDNCEATERKIREELEIALVEQQRLSSRVSQLQSENLALKQEIERWKLTESEQNFRLGTHESSITTPESVVCTANGVHFHRASCKWLENVPKNKLMRVEHEEAVDLGKKPCKTCCS